MNIIGQLLEIAGSLGLFLFGMKIMSEGIQKAAGNRMKAILKFMTGNRFAAVFTGVAITAIIQSSSATTVMIVSFVNAGLMNLTQSIGVILGANIGTTVTGWLVALLGFKIKVSALAIPAIGIGFPFLFVKKLKHKDIGEVLIGFGLLFLGLSFLKDSVPDISQNPEALQFLTRFSSGGIGSTIIFLLVGTLVTFIVQSSSAAMAITLTMAYQGWISYPAAAALVLGQNIGTTITAYLASIGTSTTAKQASRAHILFNIIGSLWVVILFTPFLRLVDFIVPGDVYGVNSAILLPAHLAMYHTIFNVINTVLFMPFIPVFAKFIEKTGKEKQPQGEEDLYTFTYISSALQDTPELYLIAIQDEIFKMAELTSDMFSRFSVVFKNPDKNLGSEVKKLKKQEELSDQMQHALSTFMAELVKDSLNPISAGNVSAQARIVNELESVGDSCFSLILLTERKYNNEIQFPKEAKDEFSQYIEKVQQYIDFIKNHLNRHISSSELNKALAYENIINTCRNKTREKVQMRLSKGSNVTAELMLLDFARHLEHIGDYNINIAEALVSIN